MTGLENVAALKQLGDTTAVARERRDPWRHRGTKWEVCFVRKLDANLDGVGALDLVPDTIHFVPKPRWPSRSLVRDEDRHQRHSRAKHAQPQGDLSLGRRVLRLPIDKRNQRLHFSLDFSTSAASAAVC